MCNMFEDCISFSRLVESHRAFVAELAALERLAYHLGGHPGTAALDNLDEAVTLLRGRLAEHMRTEERQVYPRIAEALGSFDMQSMVEDHQDIRHWVEELVRAWSRLERPSPDLETVRWILYVIVGIVSLHLRKEELAYLRMLAHQVEPAVSL
jgi:iron-sulfur cluster repair protein YtfE (RIC family)